MTFDEWKAANSDDYGLDVGALPADVSEQFARKVWGAAMAAECERWLNWCNAEAIRHLKEVDQTGSQRHRGAAEALQKAVRACGPNE